VVAVVVYAGDPPRLVDLETLTLEQWSYLATPDGVYKLKAELRWQIAEAKRVDAILQ
jgi:hypothetical protein